MKTLCNRIFTSIVTALNFKRYSLRSVLYETIPIITILAISVIILRNILFHPGLILWGNFVSPVDLYKYLAHFYPMWNQYGGFPVFSDMTLWIMGPAIIVSSWLHISSEWFFKLLMLGTTITMGVSMYVMTRIMARYVCDDKPIRIIAAMAATLVYILNPWVMSNMSHLVFLMSYSLVPFIFICFERALKTGEWPYIIGTALLWCLATLTPQYPIFIGILILCWFIFSVLYEIKRGGRPVIFNLLRITGIVIGIYLVFNIFWILPHLKSGFIGPGYDLRIEDLNHLSRNGAALNVIRFLGFWEPASISFYEPLNQNLHYFWLLGGYLIPIFALAAIFLNFKNKKIFKYVLFFSLMSLVLIFLAGGTGGFFPSLYKWFIFNIPFFSAKFGWLFREPNKIAGLLAFMFSILIGLTIAGMYRKKWHIGTYYSGKYITTFTMVIFSGLFLVFVSPCIGHYLNDYLVPHKIPAEINEISKWSKEQSGDYQLLWLPQHINDSTWGYTHPAYDFYYTICDNPSLGGEGSFTASTEYFYDYIYYVSLLTRNTSYFSRYINPLNIKYIIEHKDVIGNERESEKVINNLYRNDLNFYNDFGFIHVFENPNYFPHIFIPKNNFLLYGGYPIMDWLYSLEDINSDAIGLKYAAQAGGNNNDNVDGVILGNMQKSIDDIALSNVEDKYLVRPAKYTEQWDPNVNWSHSDLINWHWFMRGYGFLPEPYDFDYGKGIVSTIDYNVNTPNQEPTQIGISDPSIFQATHSSQNEAIHLSAAENNLLVDYTFSNENALSIYAVKNIDGENWSSYDTVSVQVYGDGSGNTFSMWYENVRPDYTRDWVGIGSWTMDWKGWKTVSFNMLPEQRRANVGKFQISVAWDINKSKSGLGTHQIQVNNLVLSSSGKQPPRHLLNMPVNVENPGQYVLYGRILKGPYCGELKFKIDQQDINDVNAKDRAADFIWEKIGVLNLTAGNHVITVENTFGFNSINLLALMPQDVADEKMQQADQFLKGKDIIHLLWYGYMLPFHPDTGALNYWTISNVTENEKISLNTNQNELIMDYTFKNEGAKSVYSHYKFKPQDWTNYDTLKLNVFGDNSRNLIDFWYIQDGVPCGIGQCNLDWTGWKEISFNIDPQLKKNNVSELMISISWDINKSLEGLGTHDIKIKDVSISTELIDPVINFNIASENDYIIGCRVKTGPDYGSIQLDLDGQTLEINLNNDKEELKWVYSKPLVMNQGVHTLQLIGSKNAKMENLIVFHGQGSTINDILEADTPANVTQFERIDATKYVAHISAKAPFYLALAENYNPLWIAEVNGKEYQSQPLYSVINGFYIDQTGDLDIVIRYKPQRLFDIGAVLAGSSLVLAFGWLVWDWRRRKRRAAFNS